MDAQGSQNSVRMRITREKPTCFVFMVDQSGSMHQEFKDNSGKRKSEGVSDAINHLLYTLMQRSSDGEEVRDYYYIGVVGYNNEVNTAWGGKLAGEWLLPVSEVAKNPLRVETRTRKVPDGAGGLVEMTVKFPVWFDPVAKGSTKMCEAFQVAYDLIKSFIDSFPDGFPPIVINITDGKPTDANPLENARQIQRLTTKGGNVMVFNLHISEIVQQPIMFPSNEDRLVDDYSRLLFRMSSLLSQSMLDEARTQEADITEGARGFVFNGDLVSVVKFLNIGTVIANN